MTKTPEEEKKKKERKGSLFKISLLDGFQFLFVQINHLVSPKAKHWRQMGYSKQLMG